MQIPLPICEVRYSLGDEISFELVGADEWKHL